MSVRPIDTTIRKLEEQLMTPAFRNDPSLVSNLLADDFVEFGSSGQVHGRRDVVAMLAVDSSPVPEVADFRAIELTPKLVLATYRTIAAGERSQQALRSSIWRFAQGRWQLVFHQGTPIPST